MSVAIKIENLSKQYRLGLVSTRTMSHDLNRWWQINIRGKEDPYLKIGDTNDRAIKGESEYVWALKDINLEVQEGEVLGIIGKNGAGKSTLLKILSKVTAPTTGIIKARGRIASLLEVGTGFHSEMTGRENIFLNGAILGMTKTEIRSRLDEIIYFSGVERYIDTPVKRYSSGMMVRLGFAVAAHLEPEILIVDEVLAVGDAEFQKKAIGKMQDVSQGEGRTVLFVSHNMETIQNLCTKTLFLEFGKVKSIGKTEEICNLYINQYNRNLGSFYKYSNGLNKYVGDNYVQLLELSIVSKELKPITTLYVTTEFGILIKYKIHKFLYKPDLSFLISGIKGEKIFHSIFETKDYTIGEKMWVAWFNADLFNNLEYLFTLGITTSNPVYIHLQNTIKFEVKEDLNSVTRQNNYKGEFHGVLRPNIIWEKI